MNNNLSFTKLNRQLLSNLILIISFITFLSGYRLVWENTLITSLVLLYLGIVVKLNRNSTLLFLFLSSFMVFLVTRSVIDIVDGYDWYTRWDYNNVIKGLSLLYLSICSLFLGYRLNWSVSLPTKQMKIKNTIDIRTQNTSIYTVVICVFYLITYLFALYVEIDKLIFMNGRLYEEYYLYYQPSFNLIIKMLSSLNIYFFILILSLRPRKVVVNTLLLFGVILTLPALIIGQRGSFVLSILFSIVYYILMQVNYKNEKWITKQYIIIFCISLPLIVIGLNAINEMRHGTDFNFSGIFDTAKTFIHKQGVTFDTFMNGVTNEETIRSLTGSKNYLFGEFIDFIKYNPISLRIFNVEALPSGNNAIKALQGNSYAHILSYVSHHSYLKGFGFGSSYVLEAFQTYGVIGITAVNIFLGTLIQSMEKFFKKNILSRFLVLLLVTDLLYLPRQPFSTLLLNIFHPYFILFVIIITIIILISNMFEEYNCDSGLTSKIYRFIFKEGYNK